MSQTFPLTTSREYLMYRQTKVGLFNQALEMYVTRLQREGARQWLADGLMRIQKRRQALAEQKVMLRSGLMYLCVKVSKNLLAIPNFPQQPNDQLHPGHDTDM